MILYAVAAEQSLGRLFLAAIGPALLLVVLFSAYAMWRYRREYRDAKALHLSVGTESELLTESTLTLRQKMELLPRVLPFVIQLTGVMIALYGGYATPSETAGLGAVLALALIAGIYSVWSPRDLEPILTSTLRESTMLMFIIGMSLLYILRDELFAHQPVGCAVDRRIAAVALDSSRGDPADGRRARLLPAPSLDHPDDGADHPAAA
jgi:C4-dicarboxylate transporter DctM subunit